MPSLCNKVWVTVRLGGWFSPCLHNRIIWAGAVGIQENFCAQGHCREFLTISAWAEPTHDGVWNVLASALGCVATGLLGCGVSYDWISRSENTCLVWESSRMLRKSFNSQSYKYGCSENGRGDFCRCLGSEQAYMTKTLVYLETRA